MRLYELSVFDEKKLRGTDWTGPQEVENWLLSHGFEILGMGEYSTALGRKGFGKIVKISHKQDRCWLKFADVARKNPSNPHLPRIAWMHSYGENNRFFIAGIEKLRPVKLDDLDALPPGELAAVIGSVDLVSDWEALHYFMKKLKKLHADEIGDLPDHEAGYALDDIISREAKKTQLGQTIESLGKLASFSCHIDLHDENIMVRPRTGEIVVIDPLAE